MTCLLPWQITDPNNRWLFYSRESLQTMIDVVYMRRILNSSWRSVDVIDYFRWEFYVLNDGYRYNPLCRTPTGEFYALTTKHAMTKCDKKLIELGFDLVSKERAEKLRLLL